MKFIKIIYDYTWEGLKFSKIHVIIVEIGEHSPNLLITLQAVVGSDGSQVLVFTGVILRNSNFAMRKYPFVRATDCRPDGRIKGSEL